MLGRCDNLFTLWAWLYLSRDSSRRKGKIIQLFWTQILRKTHLTFFKLVFLTSSNRYSRWKIVYFQTIKPPPLSSFMHGFAKKSASAEQLNEKNVIFATSNRADFSRFWCCSPAPGSSGTVFLPLDTNYVYTYNCGFIAAPVAYSRISDFNHLLFLNHYIIVQSIFIHLHRLAPPVRFASACFWASPPYTREFLVGNRIPEAKFRHRCTLFRMSKRTEYITPTNSQNHLWISPFLLVSVTLLGCSIFLRLS